MNKPTEPIALITLLLFTCQGITYYALLFPTEIPEQLLTPLQTYQSPITLLSALFYLLFWIIESSDPRKKQPKQAPHITTLSLLTYSLGTLLLYLFPGKIWPILPGILSIIIGGYQASRGLSQQQRWGISNPKKKESSKLGFTLRLKDGYINLVNPFRGVLVIGAAGSGKSYSIAEPMLEQAAALGYTGILYDFKFPTLSDLMYTCMNGKESDIQLRIINFKDLSRSHRVNPIKAKNLPMVAYAEEYAQAVISNLRPDTIAKKDYWIQSATKMFSATIWYMKKHHPEYCTLPHIVALICNRNFKSLFTLLQQDIESGPLVSDMSAAVELGADKQVAGVIGTLQNALSALNTPEIFWVLTGDDFELDLNNPSRKTFLCVGTDPTLSQTFAPVVACIITVALKLMNQQNKHHSICLLDEAPTLYIPKFDQIPATARSNKIATVYMAQDLSQMVQSYGETNSEVILGNLNNQFFGKVANQRTAKHVAEMVGREEKEILSYGQGTSGKGTGFFGTETTSSNLNHSLQERDLVKPQEVLNQSVGEFTGLTVGKQGNQWFKGQIIRDNIPKAQHIPPFSFGINPRQHFELIHQQANELLDSVSL